MLGHLWDRLVCLLYGHQERLWTVSPKGGGWLCSRCFDFEPSRAVKHRPRLVTPSLNKPTGAGTPVGHASPRSRRTAQP